MDNTSTNAGETGGNGTATEPAAETKKSSRFVQIQTQRYMYNVDKCRELPLVGYLLNLLQMQPIENRVWHAFVIRTTEPTKGIDRDENVVDVPEGSDVLIPATYELAQFLMKAAFAPRTVWEVTIKAKTKIKLSKIRSMWTFDIAANPVPVPRAQFGVSALTGNEPKLLTYTVNATGEPVDASGQGSDDEIPF